VPHAIMYGQHVAESEAAGSTRAFLFDPIAAHCVNFGVGAERSSGTTRSRLCVKNAAFPGNSPRRADRPQPQRTHN
jgi:hypothetical protein